MVMAVEDSRKKAELLLRPLGYRILGVKDISL
jgi:hypothetical protein